MRGLIDKRLRRWLVGSVRPQLGSIPTTVVGSRLNHDAATSRSERPTTDGAEEPVSADPIQPQAGLRLVIADDQAQTRRSMAAVDLFVSILGSEAGNLALKVLAIGGVYVGGGIPSRILSQLKTGRFMRAFVRKGRFSDVLSGVPVHVIRNPEAGLIGAAYHGLETLDAADGGRSVNSQRVNGTADGQISGS